jgi:hypothetical protein
VWQFSQQQANGATIAAPTSVRAFTGGTSVALLWNPAAGTTPKSYEVYRNGAKVAAAPPSNVDDNTTTQRYYDTNVIPGTTYNYQVLSISTTNVKSVLTPTYNVTHPLNPAPVPTITLDPNIPAAYQAYMANGKALLEIWYPKMATQLGWPATPLRSTFTLSSKANSGYYGAYVTGGDQMVISEEWLRDNVNRPAGQDIFIHEGMHVVQQYQGTPGWIVEGMADWFKYYTYNNITTTNPTAYTYMNGYERAGYFFDWISKQYKLPNFTKDLTAAATAGYSHDFFIQQTGKPIGELWNQMTSKKVSSPMKLKNAGSGTCADVLNYSTTNGNTIQITGCVPNDAQDWMFQASTATSADGVIKGLNKCMQTQGTTATADGTRVEIWDCTNGSNQKWALQSNGSIRNVLSGKCLQPKAGAVATGTNLEIRTCTGAAIQNWNVHPLYEMKNVASAKCNDIAKASTANGAVAEIYTCANNSNQQWKFVNTTLRSADGSLQSLGKCLDISGSSKLDGAKVQLWTCNSTAAQKWVPQVNGTVINPNSGKCLQPKAGKTASSTPLEIRTCNGTPIQQWSAPSA